MITSSDSVMILLFPLNSLPHYRESCQFHLEGNPAFPVFHIEQLKKKRKKGNGRWFTSKWMLRMTLKLQTVSNPKSLLFYHRDRP